MPVRFVAETSQKGNSSDAFEDIFEELAQDDQRSLARELRADAQADLMGGSRVDSKQVMAELKSVRSDAAEAVRLARSCHDVVVALERQEVPEALLSAIGKEVRAAVTTESHKHTDVLARALRVGMRKQCRPKPHVAAAMHGDNSPVDVDEAASPRRFSVERQNAASPATFFQSDHAKGGNDTSREMQLFEMEAAQNVALFGEELRDAAEQARAELDNRIGLQLQNLREVFEAYALRWEGVWNEVPEKPLPCLLDGACSRVTSPEEAVAAEFGGAGATPPGSMRIGIGATPVAEIDPAALAEATPPPDEDEEAARKSCDDPQVLERGAIRDGPSPREQRQARRNIESLPVQQPALGMDAIPHTPRSPGREKVEVIRFNLEESERRLEDLMRRLAETTELEHRARQESELWLLGRVENVRSELRDVLSRVVDALDNSRRLEFDAECSIQGPIEGEPITEFGRPEGLFKMIGEAVTAFATAPSALHEEKLSTYPSKDCATV